ncbi:hypothetical protein GGE43_004721 [Agrobacterium tumefaciens]|jgi:hypothetical protein|uniref:Uncharacterized protein n=1 Tax=Agrobacterium radiobacter TaxID=362 RepID=A0ABR6J6R7_AGRRD|nr:hypothetical protein [Agrobacterium radiobacter]MBB4283932.1 hypothetical protein [Agrobacterium radiobacter]MBB4319571.1 hypothetical protein [Agrobacterium radiobacter]MBB4325959.1 hypothetical protein [Agrobacterium radiobacter]MBB4337897.1 hypothetical protein [Agrobacterium radiobacter]MBB4459258.1 hypothetical protein [Agrobacterium radiobacter]
MSMQWLLAKAPGFHALPEADRGAIFNFTFLWSLFEAQVMGNFARADLICAKVDEWRDSGTLDADQYGTELAYFQQRYYVNGGFTHHFPHLHLRPADQPGIVQSVLDGSNTDPRDRLLTVMMIVWRFRNNLFHGEKWAYQLEGQLSNFTHANAALMRLLEQHGQLAN